MGAGLSAGGVALLRRRNPTHPQAPAPTGVKMDFAVFLAARPTGPYVYMAVWQDGLTGLYTFGWVDAGVLVLSATWAVTGDVLTPVTPTSTLPDTVLAQGLRALIVRGAK